MAIVAASLGSVPLVAMQTRRGKRLLPKSEKLKFAVVECAGCSVCKNTIQALGKDTLNLMSNLASGGGGWACGCGISGGFNQDGERR